MVRPEDSIPCCFVLSSLLCLSVLSPLGCASHTEDQEEACSAPRFITRMTERRGHRSGLASRVGSDCGGMMRWARQLPVTGILALLAFPFSFVSILTQGYFSIDFQREGKRGGKF